MTLNLLKTWYIPRAYSKQLRLRYKHQTNINRTQKIKNNIQGTREDTGWDFCLALRDKKDDKYRLGLYLSLSFPSIQNSQTTKYVKSPIYIHLNSSTTMLVIHAYGLNFATSNNIHYGLCLHNEQKSP